MLHGELMLNSSIQRVRFSSNKQGRGEVLVVLHIERAVQPKALKH